MSTLTTDGLSLRDRYGVAGGQGRDASSVVEDSVLYFDVLGGVTVLLLLCLALGMVRGCA